MADPRLPLACFGKVPCYGDYLKVNVSQPTARTMQDLMLHAKQAQALGDEATGGQGAYRDVAIESRLRILFGLPGSRELLVGVLRPSRDGGGRHFPFLAFTYLTRRAYGRQYSLLPLALDPVWEGLDEAWDSLAEATTREDFRERMDATELPALADVKAVRGGYQGRMREDIERTFEGSNRASPAHLRANLPELVKRLRTGEGVSVQFPVSAELAEACFDVSVWIDVVNRQFRLKRFEPSVFLDERPGPSGRWVILRFGAVRPDDYLDIVGRPAGDAFARPAHAAERSGEDVANDCNGMTYEDLLAIRA